MSAVSPRGKRVSPRQRIGSTRSRRNSTARKPRERERQRACSSLARWSGFAGGQLSNVHSVRQHARPRPDQRGWSNEIVSRRGSLLARDNETYLLGDFCSPSSLHRHNSNNNSSHLGLFYALFFSPRLGERLGGIWNKVEVRRTIFAKRKSPLKWSSTVIDSVSKHFCIFLSVVFSFFFFFLGEGDLCGLSRFIVLFIV